MAIVITNLCEPCFICEATWGVAKQQQQKKGSKQFPNFFWSRELEGSAKKDK
jgi:hypothetical protein